MKNMTGAGALKMARGVKTSQTCSPAQLKLKLFSNLPSYTCCFNFVHSLFSNLENRAIRRDQGDEKLVATRQIALLNKQRRPLSKDVMPYSRSTRMCLYSKVSLILMSPQYSQETWILWPESFLVGQTSLSFVLHTQKATLYNLFIMFSLLFFLNNNEIKGKVFDACKMNDKEILSNKNSFAYTIHIF